MGVFDCLYDDSTNSDSDDSFFDSIGWGLVQRKIQGFYRDVEIYNF